MNIDKHKSSALPGDNKAVDITGQVSKLSYLLDESIRLPGGFRVGWDGIIGLIPGVGDMLGLAASSYILYLASQGGVGKLILVRMGFNVLLETAIGSIPVIGDLFDFAYKANSRNLKLLQRYNAEPARVRKISGLWLVVFSLLLLAAIAGIVVMIVLLLRWLVEAAA